MLVVFFALVAVLTIFLYPTINLPATKLIRPLVLAAILITIFIAGLLLLAIAHLRGQPAEFATRRDIPLVDLVCSRLC
jgi:hypothetical protein